MRQIKRWAISFLAVTILFITIWSIIQPDSDPKNMTKVGHNLAVIVPFRERFTNLIVFIPHLHSYLRRKGIPHTIYVVNQADDYRFNRGFLLNIGIKESELMESRYFESSVSAWTVHLPPCSMVALHDVDLLPVDEEIKYEHNGLFPYHLIPYWMHPRYYTYSTYIGGAMIISRDSYRQVNGFSNNFWGWGLEDDEFGIRLRTANLLVQSERKPAIIKPKFQHIHTRSYKREKAPLPENQGKTHLDRTSGLNTTQYTLLSRMKAHLADAEFWIINVKLHCDKSTTPHCEPDMQ